MFVNGPVLLPHYPLLTGPLFSGQEKKMESTCQWSANCTAGFVYAAETLVNATTLPSNS